MILALDPGVTTGYASLADNGEILDTGNWRPEDIEMSLSGLLLHLPDISEAVVETFPLAPTGHLAHTLREVVATINLVLTEADIKVTEVTPGVWKTSSIRQSPDTFAGERTTPHQRDAIRMGRWFLRKRALRNPDASPGYLEQPPLHGLDERGTSRKGVGS